MNLTRTEYEERIKIAIYRGASWATNRKEGDKIEDEVRDTLNILEKRSLVTRKEKNDEQGNERNRVSF